MTARKSWHLDVTLTAAEREWIAAMLSDALSPLGRDFDSDDAARLIEARVETIVRRRLEPLVALADEWEHDALASGDCPDGYCGTCSMGNAANLIRIAIDDYSEREADPDANRAGRAILRRDGRVEQGRPRCQAKSEPRFMYPETEPTHVHTCDRPKGHLGNEHRCTGCVRWLSA